MRILFQGRQKAAVLPEFATDFHDIKTLLESGASDSKLINSRISKLKDRGMLNPYATTQVNKLVYFSEKKFGSEDKQINALNALLLYQGMSGKNGRFLDDETAVIAYKELFNLHLEKGDYSGANRAYNSLWKIDPKVEKIYKETIDQLNEFSKDDRAFEMPLEITNRGYVSRNLWKRSFSFFDVNGKITGLKLRCELKHQELTFQPETLYQIPKEWGDCNLQISGDPRTKTIIVQQ
jgi:hypothetical protein